MSSFYLPLVILITICGCCGAAPVSKHVCDDLANQNLIISNTEAPGEEVMVGYLDNLLFLIHLQIKMDTNQKSWSQSLICELGGHQTDPSSTLSQRVFPNQTGLGNFQVALAEPTAQLTSP